MTTNDLASFPAGHPEWLPSGIQSVAILLAVFHNILAVVAFALCLKLFRRHRQMGWVLVGAVFLEPLYVLLVHAINGEPLLYYQSETVHNGVLIVRYKFDFPVLYILSVIGLFMLAQRKDKSKEIVGLRISR